MTKDQAMRCCNEVNDLDSHYAGAVEPPVHGRLGAHRRYAVVIRHRPSGNEIGHTLTLEGFRYTLAGIKRRLTPSSTVSKVETALRSTGFEPTPAHYLGMENR